MREKFIINIIIVSLLLLIFEKINVEKESIREKKVGERNKEGG